jgi:Protein of unknown function (DUF3455)
MNTLLKMPLMAILLATVSLLSTEASAQVPAQIAAPDATMVGTIHAEGAQLYECKRDSGSTSSAQSGTLSWKFREPIATLIVDGKTIGRHYAGPNWDHIDGSGVKAKLAASVPGATPNDIPLLKLDVTDRRGNGILSDVTTIQRINTKGGVAQGSCESEGAYRIVPYSADYVLLRQNPAVDYTSSVKQR